MQQEYGELAEFLTIYIKEAHPEDEWQMDSNEDEGVCYRQPKTLDERRAIVEDFTERFDYSVPMVVDTMDDLAEDAYSSWPERLYVIGTDGLIAYKGGVGPFGFEPDEVEAWLVDYAANRPPAEEQAPVEGDEDAGAGAPAAASAAQAAAVGA